MGVFRAVGQTIGFTARTVGKIITFPRYHPFATVVLGGLAFGASTYVFGFGRTASATVNGAVATAKALINAPDTIRNTWNGATTEVQNFQQCGSVLDQTAKGTRDAKILSKAGSCADYGYADADSWRSYSSGLYHKVFPSQPAGP